MASPSLGGWIKWLCSLQRPVNLRKTVRSGLFGPFVNWPSARCGAGETVTDSVAQFGASL